MKLKKKKTNPDTLKSRFINFTVEERVMMARAIDKSKEYMETFGKGREVGTLLMDYSYYAQLDNFKPRLYLDATSKKDV